MEKTNYQNGEVGQRPWGQWEVLNASGSFTVKVIKVSPKQRLSLQYHHHRSEHWVLVEGNGVVTVGADKINIERGSHIYIPKEVNHRIENTGSKDLVFVEVQFGDVLDENDIVRVEDDYQRA